MLFSYCCLKDTQAKSAEGCVCVRVCVWRFTYVCVYTQHAKIPQPDESYGHLQHSSAQEVSYPPLSQDLYFLSGFGWRSKVL